MTGLSAPTDGIVAPTLRPDSHCYAPEPTVANVPYYYLHDGTVSGARFGLRDVRHQGGCRPVLLWEGIVPWPTHSAPDHRGWLCPFGYLLQSLF